ncbi:hypothetical protein LIER_03242 [Lithospermum erythrorhizon]|uniref:Uncharacterized protein n=1 Tax=Lithospermum erythrorhizon TaxID=34254 RepID=A0AAV3NV53_LITER
MASVRPSPEYTPSFRHAVINDPRWIPLCGSLRGRSLSELRVIDEGAFDRLEAVLARNPDFPMMQAALENFLYWIEFMDMFAREMRGSLTHVSRRLVTDASDSRRLDRGGVPHVERADAALRVSFGSGLVFTLEDRQQLLDNIVIFLDGALQDTPAIGVHYQDLEASLSERLDSLEALAPF